MIIPNGTIVAVMDGEKLRMFRNKATEPEISLAAVAEPDIDNENTGSGVRHHNSAANPDDSRLQEDNFVASTASFLNRQVLEGKVDHLFIIADPRSLGELRKHLRSELHGKLVGELPKDLTGHSMAAIEKAIAHA